MLPDTYFSTFLVNILLIAAVLVFFFNTRNVKEEYFIRRNINNMFEKTALPSKKAEIPIELQPFSQVGSTETFRNFLTTTIPYTIFTDNDESQLAFTISNPPLH